MSTRFGQDFEDEVQARFWSWSWLVSCLWCFVEVFKLNLGRQLNLDLVNILELKLSRDTDVWLRFWNWCLVEILKMKFDQDLCKNLWYDLNKLLNPRVSCAFDNLLYIVHDIPAHFFRYFWSSHLWSCPGQLKINYLWNW